MESLQISDDQYQEGLSISYIDFDEIMDQVNEFEQVNIDQYYNETI